MKKAVAFIISVGFVISLIACGASTSAQKELTNTAVYHDYTLTLGEAKRGNGKITVHATYTNASQDPNYALSCFVVKAFQNDIEISNISNINGDEAALIKEVKNGKSLDVTYVFELADETTVEVLIGEPTAEQKTIGRSVYE